MHFPRDKHVCFGNFSVHVCVCVCARAREREREREREVSVRVIVSTCAEAAGTHKTVLGRSYFKPYYRLDL